MPQVRVWADVHSTGLIDEQGGSIYREDTTVSEETWVQLQRWVEDYDPIVAMSEKARGGMAEEIAALDRRGLALARRVLQEWPVDLRTGAPNDVVYYSDFAPFQPKLRLS
jgi:hypothetical protein